MLDFSAVAFFFVKVLYETYHVPIELINTSLGGLPVEAWISEDALKRFPAHYREAQKFKDSSLITKNEQADVARRQAWYTQLNQKDKGYHNPQQPCHDPALNTSG